jgi:DNA repair protein RecO (recombination protein O)
MLEKDEGVVLAVTRSGETSLLVTYLSRRRGKIRLMAKGALAPKHPSRGLLETGNHIEAVYYYKENRSLFYLKEASLLSPSPSNRDSLIHLAVRLAATELLYHVCYPGSADEAIVDLAVEFGDVGTATDPLFLFLAFELKLLAALGAFPELSGCARCGGEINGGVYHASDGVAYCRDHAREVEEVPRLRPETLEAIHRCTVLTLSELATEEVSKHTRKDLGKIVHWTYTHHIQGYSLPKSLSLI